MSDVWSKVFDLIFFYPASARDCAPVVLQTMYHGTLWGLAVY